MKKNRTAEESEHLADIKAMPCGVCCAPPPSYAHHPRFCEGMGQRAGDYLAIPLCWECHQGKSGIHGDRALWKVYRLEEVDVLAKTVQRLRALR